MARIEIESEFRKSNMADRSEMARNAFCQKFQKKIKLHIEYEMAGWVSSLHRQSGWVSSSHRGPVGSHPLIGGPVGSRPLIGGPVGSHPFIGSPVGSHPLIRNEMK